METSSNTSDVLGVTTQSGSSLTMIELPPLEYTEINVSREELFADRAIGRGNYLFIVLNDNRIERQI